MDTAAMPAMIPQNQEAVRLGQMGKVPVILPVWPFIANT